MSDSVSLTSKTSSAGRRGPSGLIGWSFTSFFSSGFDWSRPRSQDTGRRENKFIAVNAKTISSSWLRASTAECTSPRSGLERDARASATVTRMRRRSPGRTGRVQRSSSRPGWPHGKGSGRRRDACKRQWCAHSWQSPRGTGPSPTTPGRCGSTAGRSPGPRWPSAPRSDSRDRTRRRMLVRSPRTTGRWQAQGGRPPRADRS